MQLIQRNPKSLDWSKTLVAILKAGFSARVFTVAAKSISTYSVLKSAWKLDRVPSV